MGVSRAHCTWHKIQAHDMIVECLITKLMWALKHAESYKKVSEMMHTNYTVEINKEGKLY
jgi:L-asparaginase/Glu-tRNA(Gln) amidotransferase subunit D